jgi:hypothetical protein
VPRSPRRRLISSSSSAIVTCAASTQALPLAVRTISLARRSRLDDDDRTSALLILASGVWTQTLQTPVTARCSRATIPQPHDQAQRHSEDGQEGRRIGVVPCGWSLGWRHADRNQFGPRIRLR